MTTRGLLAVVVLLALPTRAKAAEDIDDPKLARRLGARQDTPVPPAPVPAAPPPAAAPPPSTAPAETVERRSGDGESGRLGVPRIKLGFRRFDFVRVGASNSGSANGTASSEPFDSVSIDLYPVSTVVRFGLTTQYGWQSGSLGSNGDYFVAESFSLGGQMPRQQITPFAEVFAGGGYMRRVQFDRTIPTVYWQLGVDAGAEIFVAQHAYLSVAAGYLHPVNGFAAAQMNGTSASASFVTVFVDTWSFKLGVGF